MSDEAQEKNEKFKVEIRRRQRGEIMKKQREIYITEQKKQLLQKNNQRQVIEADQTKLQGREDNVKQFYTKFITSTSFMDQATDCQIENAMNFLVSDSSLNSVEGAAIIGSFLQFCGSLNPKNEMKIKIIRKSLSLARIEERIFELIANNIKEREQKKVKLYLNCLKNMALIRMEKVVEKSLLEKYLATIISNFVSEPSVLVFLSYVSQFHSFSPHIMEVICQQAQFKQKIIKIMIATIISNYLSLQANPQNIFILFQTLIQTLIHLYIVCKGYGTKYGHACLFAIIKLVSKFPEGMANDLLQKITKTKLQDTMIVMLSVSNEETKQIVYELEEIIVDKTIHELREDFFLKFSHEIIYQFLLGIQYTNISIVSRCLKILLKIFHYASKPFFTKIESEHDLSYVLEDLSYHKNDFISTVAEQLKKYLPNEGSESMNDQ